MKAIIELPEDCNTIDCERFAQMIKASKKKSFLVFNKPIKIHLLNKNITYEVKTVTRETIWNKFFRKKRK